METRPGGHGLVLSLLLIAAVVLAAVGCDRGSSSSEKLTVTYYFIPG